MAEAANRRAKKPAKAAKASKKGAPPRHVKKPAPRRVVAVPVGKRLSSIEEMHIIEKGAPVSLATQLQKGLGLTQEGLSKTLGIPHRTFVARLKQSRFNADVSDRVLRLKRIFEQAVHTFEGDEQMAIQWLRSPNRALEDRSPLELIATSTGARAVEQVLGRIEFGMYS